MPGPPTPFEPSGQFLALAEHRFVSMTTFRKSGEEMPTPVWIAALGENLLVTTPAASGKVKRLRHTPRVLLTPCGRFGAITPGAATVEAACTILGPDERFPGQKAAFLRKYRVEYRIVVALEAWHRRRRGHDATRIILQLSPAGFATASCAKPGR